MRRHIIGLSFMIGIFLLLVGCGSNSILDKITEKYPLQDVVESSIDSSDTATVFVAENESLEDVSKAIQDIQEPNNASEIKDNKQVFIYDNYFVTLTSDEENPDNTLIEVATQGFARDNYSPGFFSGFFTYYLLDEIFDVDDWGKHQKSRCLGSVGGCYQGYNTSGGSYKGPSSPSIFRGSSHRGGGPGAGK